jgi:hypothetical protein
MARNRQIGPAKRDAPFARPAPPSAEQHQAEYRAMLAKDLGQPVFNRRPSHDNGRPVGLIRLMLRPAGLFGMALMAMLALTGVKMWREGVFDSFRLQHTPTVQVADKSWMLGDRLPPPPPEKIVDPMAPKIKAASRPVEPAADDVETTDDAPE